MIGCCSSFEADKDSEDFEMDFVSFCWPVGFSSHSEFSILTRFVILTGEFDGSLSKRYIG